MLVVLQILILFRLLVALAPKEFKALRELKVLWDLKEPKALRVLQDLDLKELKVSQDLDLKELKALKVLQGLDLKALRVL
jgi:hypothetical protein